MSAPVTAQHMLDRVLCLVSVHLAEHGAALRVAGLPPYQPDCGVCFELMATVQMAQALVEAAALVPPAASLVPPAPVPPSVPRRHLKRRDAMQPDRVEQIERAIAEVEAQGLPWTNRLFTSAWAAVISSSPHI